MRTWLSIGIVGLLSSLALGQAVQPAGAPATQPAASGQPDGAGQPSPAEAVVGTVQGMVQVAPTKADGSVGEWRTPKEGDRLSAGTRIRTLFNSSLTIKFTDDTVIQIESGTMASIDDFRTTSDTKTVKLGIAHGAIRGASAETTLRSDLTIESPTAVLSKRGTVGYRIEYEPITGHFRISLETEGLVEALNKLTEEFLKIRPGEYVTEAMKRWLETAIFDDYISYTGTFGMTEGDAKFGAFHAGGVGYIEPSGGWDTRGLVGLRNSRIYEDTVYRQRGAGVIPPVIIRFPRLSGPPSVGTPEGNFGTGPGS